MASAEIKDFNALIDNLLTIYQCINRPFLDQPVKNKQEVYEKLIKMPRNDNYTTGNLLDYLYHQNYYKLIDIDLSRQTNTNISQQISFTGKLKDGNDAIMFFIVKKQQKTMLNFCLSSLIVSE